MAKLDARRFLKGRDSVPNVMNLTVWKRLQSLVFWGYCAAALAFVPNSTSGTCSSARQQPPDIVHQLHPQQVHKHPPPVLPQRLFQAVSPQGTAFIH